MQLAETERRPLRLRDVDVVAPELIGGAYVMLPITQGGKYIGRGAHLTRDEVLAMRNQEALQSAGYFKAYLQAPIASVGERFIVACGKGRYDVVAGLKLNAEPLTKDEAAALAGRP